MFYFFYNNLSARSRLMKERKRLEGFHFKRFFNWRDGAKLDGAYDGLLFKRSRQY